MFYLFNNDILIKSCIFHYEFEFIHPFANGNGRIGRMWHTLLLSQWNELFAWLPIEVLMRVHQQEYYDALAVADKKADCTEFIEMMMKIIYKALTKLDGKSNKFTEVANSHWAYKFINSAATMDWIKGYADGTFKPDNNITRAEVVTIVNRVTDREADTEYVNKNLSSLNRFNDLTDNGY